MALLPVTFKNRHFLLWEDTRYGHATYVFVCPRQEVVGLVQFAERIWEEVWSVTRYTIRHSSTLGFLDRATHTRFKAWKDRVDSIFRRACGSDANHEGRVKVRRRRR
jgi:hypothetical protein